MYLHTTVFFLTYLSVVFSEKVLFHTGKIRYANSSTIIRKDVENVEVINEDLAPDAIFLEVYKVKSIADLKKHSVSDLKSLKKLNMANCGISKISPGAFHNVPKLEALELEDNNITSIEAGVFNNLNLVVLHLHRNLIESIAKDAFDDMPNLKTIKLNNNYLQIWDSDWFKNCPQLSEIYLRRNELTKLPKDAFRNLLNTRKADGKSLEDVKIYLSKNCISDIDPGTFKGIKKLNELWLDRNALITINANVFADLEEISVLILLKNKINKLHSNQFPKLQSMTILDVIKNNITCLPLETVKNVKHVFLNKNKMDCDCVSKLRSHLSDTNKSRILYHDC